MSAIVFENCALATGAFLRKSRNAVSIHPMALKPLLLNAFSPTEKYSFFNPPGIGTSSNRTQHRNTLFTTEDRVVRQTHSVFFFFYWWARCRCMRVPSLASVLWESCPVTRSPSCGRLHRQTVKPLPPPTCVVSSST